jgi:hypothetical protein
MMIVDVKPQDSSNQSQKTSLSDTTPPAQGLDQDNHEDVESNDQCQEESNNQEGDEDDGDKGKTPPHSRVR